MPNRKYSVRVSIDAVRANNPIEKWRKREGKTAPEMATILGYGSVDGYHKLVRCESAPLGKLSRFSAVSGIPLGKLATYFSDAREKKVA